MTAWLDKNPIGVALASVCGLLILVSLSLAYVWSRPASSGGTAGPAEGVIASQSQSPAHDLGPVSAYREVTARPVFDESRRPVVSVEGEGISMEDAGNSTVADAPDVNLGGVVITPDLSIVTLRPNSGGETLVAKEGVPLDGEYAGWMVTEVNSRAVKLASLEGDTLELELQVNNRKIEEPPSPEPSPAAKDATDPGQKAAAAGDDDEPLSRAEEIRQRIAERREELRRQAEEERERPPDRRGAAPSNYQSAIQNMINRKKDDSENDEKETDGNQ